MIAIIEYTDRWPQEFAVLARDLRAALGDRALRIDHIGSTAVPGLAAKDVIDLQVTVRDFENVAPLEAAITAVGYMWRPDITHDHQPPGVIGSDDDWNKRSFQTPPTSRRVNLHMQGAGRANQRYALLFRDYLRTHPIARDAYGIIKQQLARYHPTDMDAYYDIKDPVCDLIWSAAEEWVASTHWTIGPSDV